MRQTAAAIGVAILALYSMLNSYGVPPGRRSQGMEQAVQRIEPARDRLPAGVTAGYVTDAPLSSSDGTLQYLIAQYAVAPHLLVPMERGGAHEWAVGNFVQPAAAADAAARAGYTIAEDLGAGVVILRRTAR